MTSEEIKAEEVRWQSLLVNNVLPFLFDFYSELFGKP